MKEKMEKTKIYLNGKPQRKRKESNFPLSKKPYYLVLFDNLYKHHILVQQAGNKEVLPFIRNF